MSRTRADFEEVILYGDDLGLKVMPPVEQDLEDEPTLSFRAFKAQELLAPHSTKQATTFVRREIDEHDTQWYRRCLSLQRQARGLPAIYPTALSASQAVPKSERVPEVKDFRRGMVGFSYDPRIAGTAGHIFLVLGWTEDGRLLTATNDARGAGLVSVVDVNFYRQQWGQTIQFAATHLNGYDFSDFNAPPVPVKEGTLGERYEAALEELIKIERHKRLKGYDKLADAIERDIVRMQRKMERWNNGSV